MPGQLRAWGRRVTRTEHDGTITVIADGYNGKKLNSPNDVVVASDGSIWFTDPTYGIKGNYEGLRAETREKRLYVIDSGVSDGGPADIRVFDVDVPNGKVSNGKVGSAPG
jgi:gluconolactonase